MGNPTILEFPTVGALCADVGTRLAAFIHERPDAVLGLATGRTFLGVYEAFVETAKSRKLSCARLRTYNLDEYLGLPDDSPDSFATYMKANLFSKLDFDPSATHLPNPHAPDLSTECERYERAIATDGGIDLQLLGLGLNGHIGFNEPGSSFASTTRRVRLTPETRAQNRRDFAGREVPEEALTMGLATITRARACWLVVTGESKAEVLARCLEQKDERYPGSALIGHPALTIFADRAALREIRPQS